MEKHEDIGTDDTSLHPVLDRNQRSLADELLTPHPKMPERKGAAHHVSTKVAAYEHDAQPTQARGRIVWNKSYSFQAHGPTYLDPLPDPGLGGGY